jgi:hypothetical protein
MIVTVSNKASNSQAHDPRRKLTAEQEMQVIAMLKANVKPYLVATQFGVHPNTVGNIQKRVAKNEGLSPAKGSGRSQSETNDGDRLPVSDAGRPHGDK